MVSVSVIIPNYNHAKYLSKRIDSVLQQTYQDLEVLILDDCSKDNSREVISRYAGDPRVKLLFNEQNSGSTFKQWNKGVRATSGQYIWIAESDDFAEATLLKQAVDILDKHANIGVVNAQSLIVDENDAVIRPTSEDFRDLFSLDKWKSDFIADGPTEVKRHFIWQNMVPNASGAVFRRALFDQVGGADETMRLSGDWKFWASMLLTSDLANIGRPLNYFRTHSQNVRSQTRQWLAIEETLLVRNFIMSQLPDDPEWARDVRSRSCDFWINAFLSRTLPDRETQSRTWALSKTVDPWIAFRLPARFISRAATAGGRRMTSWVKRYLSQRGH